MLRLHTNYHSLLHPLVQMGVLTQVCRYLHAPLYHQVASIHVQEDLPGALLTQPALLFADEPTSDLDEQTETEIMEMFRQIHLDSEITIVLVTHSTQLECYGTRSIHMAGEAV